MGENRHVDHTIYQAGWVVLSESVAGVSVTDTQYSSFGVPSPYRGARLYHIGGVMKTINSVGTICEDAAKAAKSRPGTMVRQVRWNVDSTKVDLV